MTCDTASQSFDIYTKGNSTPGIRLQASGTTLIGGTIPSAPNISLNESGSAEFAGTLEALTTADYTSKSAFRSLMPVAGLIHCYLAQN